MSHVVKYNFLIFNATATQYENKNSKNFALCLRVSLSQFNGTSILSFYDYKGRLYV